MRLQCPSRKWTVARAHLRIHLGPNWVQFSLRCTIVRWRTRGKPLQSLAGAEGFEPSDAGIKIRCLTAWLRPNAWPKRRRTILTEPTRYNAFAPSRAALYLP